MDKSNGYENHAAIFIHCRSKGIDGVERSISSELGKITTSEHDGSGSRLWNRDPITKALTDEGLTVYGIDASPSMVQGFKQNLPNIPVACEAVEDLSFFNRQFDAIIAWGLMFLLPEETQEVVISTMANALLTGGKLLFTAPSQKLKWEDAITEVESGSLGAGKYKELLSASGLLLIEEFEDEGENHYYHAEKLDNDVHRGKMRPLKFWS